MRILLVSHTCQSSTEGQPKAEHLSRLPGIDLCVLVPDRWKHYGKWRYSDPKNRSANYTLEVGKVRCPWMGPAQFYLHWYPQLAELIQSFQPDIIDLWEEPWGLVSAQACMLRNRLAPETLILSETEQNIEKRLPPPFEQIRSYTLANADGAIGRSDEAVNVLRAKGYTGEATVVPNAVDTSLFRPLDKGECRSRLGLSGFVVGFIGRLVTEKGVEDLVAMLDHCQGNVSLVFAGDGPMLPELQRSLQASGKSDRVRFLGNVPAKELPIVMNALDILMLPSRSTRSWKEQFGRVIIEAQACSVPVIGSESGAIPAVVGSGGVIVPEKSPASLGKAVTTLQDSPRLLRDLGEAGLAQVLQEYTWEMVAKKMAATYTKMLNRQPSQTSSTPRELTSPSSFALNVNRPLPTGLTGLPLAPDAERSAATPVLT